MNFILRLMFSLIITTCFILLFMPILNADSIFIDYGFVSFDVCEKLSFIWKYIFEIYSISSFIAYFLIGNSIFSHFFKNIPNDVKTESEPTGLHLFIGKTADDRNVFVECLIYHF